MPFEVLRYSTVLKRDIMNNLFEELTWRGMVYDATDGLAEIFAKEHVTAYVGFDPTASSLHVGSLLTVMALKRLQDSATPRLRLSEAGPA